MSDQGKELKATVEGWLRDTAIPVASAAYRLSDKAALSLAAGFLDEDTREILYKRLQKESTTPHSGDVAVLRKISATAHEWHDVANSGLADALDNDRFATTDGKIMASDVKSAFAHRRYRKYMGSLGGYRRVFMSDPAFSKSWLGVREEKHNGIFLNTGQRNAIFDALCCCAAPTDVECTQKRGMKGGIYRLRTPNCVPLPSQSFVQTRGDINQSIEKNNSSERNASMVEKEKQSSVADATSSILRADIAHVDASVVRRTINNTVSRIARLIAGRPVDDDVWTSSKEQLLQGQPATFHFTDSYDTALYILGVVIDRMDCSAAWHSDVLATQATSIDITAEVMEVARDLVELRSVSAELHMRDVQHGVASPQRLHQLGDVWAELVDRVVALVALADAVDTVDAELVRWSDYRSVDDLDDRIDNLVARSGFRSTLNQKDRAVQHDIAESGRVMEVARSVIEHEIGALDRGTHA